MRGTRLTPWRGEPRQVHWHITLIATCPVYNSRQEFLQLFLGLPEAMKPDRRLNQGSFSIAGPLVVSVVRISRPSSAAANASAGPLSTAGNFEITITALCAAAIKSPPLHRPITTTTWSRRFDATTLLTNLTRTLCLLDRRELATRTKHT